MLRTAIPMVGRNSLPLFALLFSLVVLAGCGGAAAPEASYAPSSRMAESADSAGAAAPMAEEPAPAAAPGMMPMPSPAPMSSPAGGGAPPSVAPAARAVMGAPGAPPKPAADSAKPKADGTEAAPADKPVAPLLIYTGQLAMRIDDAANVPATIDRAIDLAESLGGYLTSRTDTSVQVRVPSARFREALTALEKLGEVIRRSVSAEDVSEQFHDLEVRLANLKAVQKRLQEFLAKAQNISDTLQVEHELERVGAEIDQIEGRMRFLRARAAFSLITLEVTAKPKAAVIADHPDIPADPRAIDLPIDWLSKIGLSSLLNLR